ncbi:hypothetical protein ASPVEDRAFT_654039 [Aspergillus versicolor CBS 583.65]|uniref:Zn(2)-C6 fungal-type domain-containing protein n=1 Tax=Aspergillus versicolor CBS 583.65 TaxID=1036611 RepID=A0A1L9PK99_ASPVE|nr:uncharacterized protein ASPVEDRAFT_654039 [Aspergillus versicolor CBS 583.65]OJJ01954.1 hypothetical protein ASPVEDRAFT_654039 [Aspergillus versicolor CBS 583.65]
MSFPSQTRSKKTEITRSRNGCVRCRQKRRKCDEGKPDCRRCIMAGTDCQYDGVTLKFREATQWAAHKVEARRCLAETPPPSTNDSLEERSGSLTEPQPLLAASYDDTLNNAAADEERNGGTADTSRTPVTFEEDSPHHAMSNSLASPTWAEVPLDFDLLPSADADTFNELLSQLSWVGPRNQPWEISPPPSSSQREAIAQPNTPDDTLVYDGSTTEQLCSGMITTPPPQQQQQTRRPLKGDVMVSHPPLKARKPPPTKVPVSHRVYLAHFRVAVLHAFPLELPFLWALAIDSPVVRCAALALAAANLANLQGKQKDHSTWAPMSIHSAKAAAFSTQANQMLEGGSDVALNARLTAMLLLVYHELEAGSFSDAFHSLSILSAAILDHAKTILSLPEGPELIRWWLHVRCLTGGAHTPLNPYGHENPTEPLASRLEMSVATAAQVIDLIGTQGKQLWERVLLGRCFRAIGDTPASTMKKVADWVGILKGNLLCDRGAFGLSETSDYFLTEEELFAELRTLKMMLATCETPSALRRTATTTATNTATAREGIVDFTQITTHREVMEAVDYAFAQIVCDEQLLHALATDPASLPCQFPRDSDRDRNSDGDSVPSHPLKPARTRTPTPTNPWAAAILRLAARVDASQCGRENAYRRGGILNTLYYTGLFCPGHVPSRSIHATVQRMLDARVHAESPFFPVHAFLGYQRALEREIRQSGRTIFFACLTYDEWTPKDKLFSKGENELVIVVGAEADGRYFHDLVPAWTEVREASTP